MSTLTGLSGCLRLAWRRNRLFLACWIAGLAVLMPLTLGQYETMIPPGTDPRATLEPLRHNPSMLALLGPAFDVYTTGGFVFWRVGGFCSTFAAMMAGFAVIRTTRAEEEEGRLELVRAGQVGRHAPLAASLLLGALAALALTAASAAPLVAMGLPVAGSLASGTALGIEALLFTGIGAVVAQVFESTRTVRGWTIGLLWGGMFLARMVIDGAGPAAERARLGWLVPLEWGMLLRPFAGHRWWVALMALALFVLLALLAFRLESARDHGAGLVAARPGPAVASPALSGAWGLAWRLQRNSLLGWSLALLLGAAGVGSIVAQLHDALADNPQLGQMLEKLGGSQDLDVAFYGAMLGIIATVVAVFGASILLRLRSEEVHGRVEPLLATATSRLWLASSHLALATVAPCLVLVGVGAALPLAEALRGGDWSPVGTYGRAAAGLLPGVLLVVGLAMALLGWLPRLTGLVWALLGWTLFATWVAVLFDLPAWLLRLQPWGHLRLLPRDAWSWTPFTVELLVALGLLALGLAGYRRRGIPA
ncbi:hypothetical protein [Luteococcus peritonei]|uniref:ABC transporter permease n=1 Tax=Luteococcus peritonei TaxID=88874 RepID=A0ABW4RWE9_9ACTN